MQQPNILLITCDQMVAQLTGAYGHPVVETPNLNRLAEEGVRFDNAYTSCAICVPARSSLKTGMYVSRTGCYDNGALFPADQPTFCHYLSSAGYDTVASGKLHFIGPDQLHGFEKRLTTDFHPADFNFLPPRPKGGFKDRAGYHAQPIAIDYVTAGVRQWSQEADFDEEVHFRALEYLRSKRSQYTGSLQKELPPRDERPFFMQVSYCYPHEPFHVPQRFWDIYEDKRIDLPEIPGSLQDYEHPMDTMLNAYHGTHRVNLNDEEAVYNMRRAYYGLITWIDHRVGELLQALEDYGLRENTAVLFLSDHGDMLGERRMVQKRSFYEYSSRIPWIMTYPGMEDRGTVVQEPVSIVDVMPTVLEFGGVQQDKILPIDGRSVIPLVEGERDPDRTIFAEIHAGGTTMTCFMVRQGNYKYIHTTGYDPQLYNLAEDPGEWNNLAGNPEYEEVESRLYDLILANFDPDQIEQDLLASLARRCIIKEAMVTTGLPRWDYQPFFDASEMYWREG